MAELVADYVLKRLSEWGVHRMFGYPGDGINGFLGAFDRADGEPEFIQARHEEMAAFMACGHAKFTGEVGVCIATSGPGAIHLLNGLYDAKLDHAPVLAIVGQQKRMSLGAALPAGGRPPDAVQGRRRVRPGLHAAGPGAAPDRPRDPHRARRARRRHAHLPGRHQEEEASSRRRASTARSTPASATRSRGSCRSEADLERRGRDPERGREGRDAGRPGRRGRRRRADRDGRAARRRGREGAARQGVAARRPAVRDRLDRPARHQAELRA